MLEVKVFPSDTPRLAPPKRLVAGETPAQRRSAGVENPRFEDTPPGPMSSWSCRSISFHPRLRTSFRLKSSPWTAERFLAVLHPPTAAGRVSVMVADGDRIHTRTYRPIELDAVAGPLLEAESYVTPNRSHGRRGRTRIAALNAVWLDLDVYRVPALAHRARPATEAIILGRIKEAGLPAPSFLIDSGRGYYAIWLIRRVVTAALPRWSALMRALVEWARPLGADPACVDAARVLRLPGTLHEGAGREVTVVAGTGERHEFESFSAAVWQAAGRPTRRELDKRKQRRKAPAQSGADAGAKAKPRGLARRTFWAIVLDDLERLREIWGGSVPAGLRDIWLHLWTTALGWTAIETDTCRLRRRESRDRHARAVGARGPQDDVDDDPKGGEGRRWSTRPGWTGCSLRLWWRSYGRVAWGRPRVGRVDRPAADHPDRSPRRSRQGQSDCTPPGGRSHAARNLARCASDRTRAPMGS